MYSAPENRVLIDPWISGQCEQRRLLAPQANEEPLLIPHAKALDGLVLGHAVRIQFSIVSLVQPPVWVDYTAADPTAQQAFYSAVLDWDFPDQHPDAGGWRPAMVGEDFAAGMSPRPPGTEYSYWTVFFGTTRIEAAVARATELGATEVLAPMPVVIDGTLMTTLAVMIDPTGAAFGLAQQAANPGITHHGHGSAGWYELASHDVAAAREFYRALLEVDLQPVPEVAPMDYAMLVGPTGAFAGTMPVFAGAPDGVPSAWSVYFAAADVDVAVARAVAGGATVLMGPETMHAGRIAYLSDPEGAMFGLLTPATP